MKDFNAKEILEIAIQNEKNGIEFYSKLLELAEKPEIKKTLSELIGQEQNHIKVLKKIINKFLEEDNSLSYYDDPEELMYLQAIAGSAVFTDEVSSPSVEEALKDVFAALHYAVSLEVKTVEFYKQVKEVMNQDSAKEAIDRLVAEEKNHVKHLYRMIKEEEG